MEIFRLKGDHESPDIILDPEKQQFSFEGKSLISGAVEFYRPVIDWILAYAKNPLKETVVEFNMRHFNTTSAKALLDVLFAFEEVFKEGKDARIIWKYYRDDDDMKDAGVDFEQLVDIPFEYVEMEK